MSSNLSEKVTNVGRTIAEGAEKAVDFVKDKAGVGPKEGSNVGVAGITEHMTVYASCGKKVGEVDRVEGPAIKLTKNASPDGQHHYVPVSWVERVDRHVHLSKNSLETEQQWQPDAASCSCH